MKFRVLLFWFILLLTPTTVGANNSSYSPITEKDSFKVSLLTCSPGSKIYELYGHTALRIQDFRTGTDMVYNFGVFSFNQPHFMFRFMLGDTDYTMDEIDFFDFSLAYSERGRYIYEQVLNLQTDEARKLQASLKKLLLIDNWSYRYNFLYDNCTTRARDMVENSLDGKIVITQNIAPLSYRQIIHQFTGKSPWNQFGQDILIGAEADAKVGYRQQTFAPYYLKDYWQTAQIKDASGKLRPLVVSAGKCIDAENAVVDQSQSPSPLVASMLWLILTTVVCFLMLIQRYKWLWAYDIIVLGAQGITGLIVAFLFFFSSHPAVGSNWLIVLFNPLPLLWLYGEVKRAKQGRTDYYHPIAMVIISLFVIASFFIPQEIPSPVLLLAFNLLILSGTRIYLYKKGRLYIFPRTNE